MPPPPVGLCSRLLLAAGVGTSLFLSWELRFGVLATDEKPEGRPPTTHEDSDCQDDPNWSAYNRGLYTCKWLAEYDPGCVTNVCYGRTDFGQ